MLRSLALPSVPFPALCFTLHLGDLQRDGACDRVSCEETILVVAFGELVTHGPALWPSSPQTLRAPIRSASRDTTSGFPSQAPRGGCTARSNSVESDMVPCKESGARNKGLDAYRSSTLRRVSCTQHSLWSFPNEVSGDTSSFFH